MPADSAHVEIKGLKELAKACDKINRNFDDVMDAAATQVAQRVATGARGAARTPQQRLAASTLSAQGNGTVGSNWAGFAGSEFGGGSRPETRQFPPYQGRRGYFLYPSMRQNKQSLNALWDEAVDEAMKPWDYKG